jgi:hypothetical protein
LPCSRSNPDISLKEISPCARCLDSGTTGQVLEVDEGSVVRTVVAAGEACVRVAEGGEVRDRVGTA